MLTGYLESYAFWLLLGLLLAYLLLKRKHLLVRFRKLLRLEHLVVIRLL